jgi:FMN phosphatase YigB (HAD superfamily)
MSKIIESKKIIDVLNHIDDKTLVVFDIDNTLIDTVQNFGGYAWSCHVTKRFQDKGFDFPVALMKSYNILAQMIEFVDFKGIEPETSGVIKKLRERNILSMALTARMHSMSKNTNHALLQAGIDFFETAIHDQKIQFNPTAAYERGVLYTGPKLRKGECLVLFFEKIGYVPEKVFFVDDSQHHVEDVHETLQSKNIPVTCLRYGATDVRESKFDPARSEKELVAAIGKERYNSIFKELL